MTVSARERWWDRTCRMYLYSPMAVQGHRGCNVVENNHGHLKSARNRVPEAPRRSWRGSLRAWRITARKREVPE